MLVSMQVLPLLSTLAVATAIQWFSCRVEWLLWHSFRLLRACVRYFMIDVYVKGDGNVLKSIPPFWASFCRNVSGIFKPIDRFLLSF